MKQPTTSYLIPYGPIMSKRQIEGYDTLFHYPAGDSNKKLEITQHIRTGIYLSHDEALRALEKETQARHFNACEDVTVRHHHRNGQPYFVALGHPKLVGRAIGETIKEPHRTDPAHVTDFNGFLEKVAKIQILREQEHRQQTDKRRKNRNYSLSSLSAFAATSIAIWFPTLLPVQIPDFPYDAWVAGIAFIASTGFVISSLTEPYLPFRARYDADQGQISDATTLNNAMNRHRKGLIRRIETTPQLQGNEA
ncbi:hypothetical protein [Marinobacter salarius]|uniref:Uncharacterized protein n=1 Tax=Marinobacter salarius TaxID=1420917 RepID=A0A1W6KFF3_9GAMM|nr:hypothetical protein [Marinobacter salarius]ARM86175.1 hypothetical protein MARSALSMR5_04155 [Marinobacter salarius]